MNKYSDFLSVDKNYQSSVNLELDFNNYEKIEQYIPTNDICDVLKIFIDVLLGKSKKKATTLVGPYGKGKSFLLLVLSFLIGNNKDTETYNVLLNKIKDVDIELFNLLKEIKNKNINLVTVVINSNYDDIKQGFQIGLSEALKREHLDEIVPNSAFKVAYDLLDGWMKNKSIKEEINKKGNKDIDLEDIKNGLLNFSQNDYEKFVNIYSCVNEGLDFNPLVNSDLIKSYSNVSSSLKKHGYSGIFVIFDEFSKFIESRSIDLNKDLKFVQDFAELANRSEKDSQIHLCCVLHKSLNLYKNSYKENGFNLDTFKTVEGRFSEIRFNKSLEENYQIISSAILKNNKWNNWIDVEIVKNKEFYDEIKENFVSFNNKDNLFKNIYPLNPLTVFALIAISEHCAQNERTLFTFLADTDENSFASFIRNNDSNLFNVDKIYDYFNLIFQKEETNSIRNIWYRSESILKKVENVIERKIIKSLAIILMINDNDNLPANSKTISMCLNLNLEEVDGHINNLINQYYLRKNILSNQLNFALSNNKNIDDKIELIKKTKIKNINIGNYLTNLNNKKYIVPRKYNEINKMSRFFNILFLDEESFKNLTSFNYYFEENYCDGLIVYLLKKDIDDKEIVDKINKINDKRIIVKYPNVKINDLFFESLIRSISLSEVKKQTGLNDIEINEIDLLKDEVDNDLFNLIEYYFGKNSSYYNALKSSFKNKNFNNFISFLMEELYPNSLIINNELINKKTLSAQYQRAENNVIDFILNREYEFNFSDTSPESLIKNSFLNQIKKDKNIRNIINEIKENILNKTKTKINTFELVKKYYEMPYGVRKGVMPLLLAQAISELDDNLIIYFDDREIELNSLNLVKSIDNSKYYLYLLSSSKEQSLYLNDMLKYFEVKSENNFKNDTINLSKALRRYFYGLPPILRLNTAKNNYLSLDVKFLKFKDLFLAMNINNYDSIFKKPLEIFELEKYNDIFAILLTYFYSINSFLDEYKDGIVLNIKQIFNIDKNTNLKSGTDSYLKELKINEYSYVLEDNEKKLLNVFEHLTSYNDYDNLNEISKVVTKQFIEDWDGDKKDQIIKSLNKLKEQLDKKENKVNRNENILNEDRKEITGMAALLKNNIESLLDEFSNGISKSDKIDVLKEILKDMY